MRDGFIERARGRWPGILAALGVPHGIMNGKHQPCPFCGGRDRFRFDDKDGTGSYICSQCGAGYGAMFLEKFHGWDFKRTAEAVESVIGKVKPSEPKSKIDASSASAAMNKLWSSGRPILETDAAAKFLHARVGLNEFPRSLRAVDGIRYTGSPNYYPAMLAMVMAPDGKPCMLHRTYLTEDGRKADVVEPRRFMPGTITKGSAVRLGPYTDVLGIAEGIETALSVTALFGVPCWSALNDGLLQAWIPPTVKTIVVYGDHDANFVGQAAAYALAKRLVRDGVAHVHVELPPTIDTDWNDVHASKMKDKT